MYLDSDEKITQVEIGHHVAEQSVTFEQDHSVNHTYEITYIEAKDDGLFVHLKDPYNRYHSGIITRESFILYFGCGVKLKPKGPCIWCNK
jgi:hypothetical protein